MDRSRLIVALALSFLVLMSWPLITRYLAPPPPIEETVQVEQPAPEQRSETKQQPSPSTTTKDRHPGVGSTAPQSTIQTTQVPTREITITTRDWRAKLSNHGAVATAWSIER